MLQLQRAGHDGDQWQIIRYPVAWPVMDSQTIRDAADRVIRRLNLRFVPVDLPVRDHSSGQRQTAAIARAAQFRSRILIMNEPTAALGPADVTPAALHPATGSGLVGRYTGWR